MKTAVIGEDPDGLVTARANSKHSSAVCRPMAWALKSTTVATPSQTVECAGE